MFDLLLEPLSFGFMRDALVIATLLGILCSVVGFLSDSTASGNTW